MSNEVHSRWGASATLWLGVGLCAATYVVISPPAGQTYPGAIPWRDASWLKPLVDLLALGGAFPTARGVEIKDVALHFAAAAGLLVLAVRWMRPGERVWSESGGPAMHAERFFVAWVLVSLASYAWSNDAATALGQARMYAFGVGWAVAVAHLFKPADLRRFLGWLTGLSAAAATLCVWYYIERNPFHRPGFPLGNPGVLAIAIMPGILAAIGLVGQTVRESRSGRGLFPPPRLNPTLRDAGLAPRPLRLSRRAVWTLVGAGLSLVPLTWCFLLANARGATLGLAAAACVVLLSVTTLRTRRTLVLLLVIGVAIAGWRVVSVSADPAMGRSDTTRLRLYVWRYAAELWQQRPFAGHGAGAFPRLANQLSLRDRLLDDAAFAGDWVEHAHNELFEVLAEIGLIGGLTWVVGVLATLATGWLLLRDAGVRKQRWLLAAVVGALVAMLVDAMFGVALRLPGAPAVFWTLVGIVWALGRSRAPAGRGRGPVAALAAKLARATGASAESRRWTRLVPSACAGLAGLVLASVALSNAVALRFEYAARAAKAVDADTRYAAVLAARGLLDPVRQIAASDLALRAAFEAARAAAADLLPAAGDASAGASRDPAAPEATDLARAAATVSPERVELAAERLESALGAARSLDWRAPTVGRALVVQARCAELLGELHRVRDPARSAEWSSLAAAAWREQRLRYPHDVETLLALLRYPDSLAAHIGYLRDALRDGSPPDEWRAAVQHFLAAPGFDEALRRFLLAVGPLDPQTDLDALAASMAPEVYRLAAEVHALRGEFEAAESDAGRAVALYQPMRQRFPTLYSIAQGERADYALRVAPQRAGAAMQYVHEAIERLPRIQQQKYEALLRPFRERLVLLHLAVGDEARAREELRTLEAREVEREAGGGAAAAPTHETRLADAYVRLAALYLRRGAAPRESLDAWLSAALRHDPRHARAWGFRAWLAAAPTRDPAAAEGVLAEAAEAGVGLRDLERVRRSLAAEFAAPATQPANESP
ncbi:MAG: O-antigen ligase family protein [Phycisphaerae bacterium]